MNATDEQFRRYVEDLTQGIAAESRSEPLDLGAIDYGGIEDVPDSD